MPKVAGGPTALRSITTEGLAEARYAVTTGEGEPEKLASGLDISRERQDKLALHSHNKATAAQRAGRFDKEIVPVTVRGRKQDTVVEVDEVPRADTDLGKLGKLPRITGGLLEWEEHVGIIRDALAQTPLMRLDSTGNRANSSYNEMLSPKSTNHR